MTKKSSRYYLLHGIVVSIVALVCLLSYAITKSLTVAEDKLQENLEYVSYEVLTDNIMPVSKEETTTNTEIIRPYTDTSVEIGKSYYDYKAESENQEDSIIYYENTYIQNTGVDYISKNIFNVNAIADGKVISVTEDDIVGNTVKIEHNNNMISVYQSIKDVTVKENDEVTQGQVIATSGTNNISSDLGNHLHFELYKENILVNPEDFLNNSQGN
ncbi:MAG: peptidoglycan DD-metalloendopeptidase family protein [Bacilli bacterium]